MSSTAFTYNNPEAAPQVLLAANLNNEANMLEMSGNYAGAEKKHLEAIALKVAAVGQDSIQAALSRNALGELYLKMNRLNDAQQMLEDADRVRRTKDDFDAACTRDNLGRLWEMKGEMGKARGMRERGGNDSMICGNFNCPRSSLCQLSKKSELKACGKCKCVFYCGASCQKADWKERHKKYCKQA